MQESYYIYSSGNLTQKDNTLRFTAIDGNVKDLPIENIKEIYIMNEITVTSKLLNLFSKYGILVHFFNYYQFYIGSFCLFIKLKVPINTELSILHRKFLPKGNKTCRSAFG